MPCRVEGRPQPLHPTSRQAAQAGELAALAWRCENEAEVLLPRYFSLVRWCASATLGGKLGFSSVRRLASHASAFRLVHQSCRVAFGLLPGSLCEAASQSAYQVSGASKTAVGGNVVATWHTSGRVGLSASALLCFPTAKSFDWHQALVVCFALRTLRGGSRAPEPPWSWLSQTAGIRSGLAGVCIRRHARGCVGCLLMLLCTTGGKARRRTEGGTCQ